MKRKTQTKREAGMPLIRLLSIGAAAALAALLWMAAGASAQEQPTITVSVGGWAADAGQAVQNHGQHIHN